MYRTQIEKYKLIANLIFMIGIVQLYLQQGSLALLYIGGAVQVMLLVTQLFFGNLAESIEYMYLIRQKRGFVRDTQQILSMATLYVFIASIVGIVLLVLLDCYLHQGAEYPYASNILLSFIVVIPLVGLLQLLRGYIQMKYSYLVCGMTYIIQALVIVLLIRFGMNSTIEYGEKVSALLQNDHLLYLYIGEKIVVYYAAVTAVLAVVVGVLLLIQPRKKVKLLDYKANDGKETKWSVFNHLISLLLPRGIMTACVHVPFLIVYKLGAEQISTGNRLIGHFYGFMLPSILVAAFVAKYAYYRLESKCGRDLRKKEARAKNYSLKLLLVYAVYVGMFVLVVLVPTVTRILSLLGFTKDIAVSQFYYACFLFAALIVPLTCLERVLGIIGRHMSVVVVYVLTTVVLIIAVFFVDIDTTLNYMHIVGIIGMYFLTVTTLLFVLVLDKYKIAAIALLPSFGSTILCAGATIAIISLITNWIVNTLGGIFVGYVSLLAGGVIYTVLVLFFYIFTKNQAKLLPGSKFYVELLELMGHRA